MAPWTNLSFDTLQAGVSGENTAYQNGDKSIIYYEITAADADVSVNVLYETVTDVSGLGDYHAVIEMTATMNDLSDGLFTMKVDGNDLEDGDDTDLLFKVHSDTNTIDGMFGTLESESVDMGAYAATDSKFSKDFVRHMAYKITGGYASADIFANESTLDSNVQTAIQTAVSTLEQAWKDLSENDYVGVGGGNILVDLAANKFKRELDRAVTEMNANGASGTLYEYVDGSNEVYPILSKLLADAQQSTDVSAECTFGFGETRLNEDGASQTESLVFHINVGITGGTLPDNRTLSNIIPNSRIYKVVVNLG